MSALVNIVGIYDSGGVLCIQGEFVFLCVHLDRGSFGALLLLSYA